MWTSFLEQRRWASCFEVYIYMTVTVCVCANMYVRICGFQQNTQLFSHLAMQSLTLIPQGHRRHNVVLLKTSPLAITTRLLPPASRQYTIDFPQEFTLLLEIQRIKKGDMPSTPKWMHTHLTPRRFLHTVMHTYCTEKCTHTHASLNLF